MNALCGRKPEVLLAILQKIFDRISELERQESDKNIILDTLCEEFPDLDALSIVLEKTVWGYRLHQGLLSLGKLQALKTRRGVREALSKFQKMKDSS